MHRSHEYLAKIAIEICDGVLIHSLLGKLKPGDIPADVRSKAIGILIDKYFVKNTVVQAGYPLDMRYAGPREALLHALFRQNYGCSHLIVGRDHAGVGSYYGPFDAHHIFDQIPKGALETQPLKIDWTFWCYKCGGMASARTCPHDEKDRLLLSGTKLRKMAVRRQRGAGRIQPRRRCWRSCATTTPALEAHEKVEVKLDRAFRALAKIRCSLFIEFLVTIFHRIDGVTACQHSSVPKNATAARVRTRPLACTSARTT